MLASILGHLHLHCQAALPPISPFPMQVSSVSVYMKGVGTDIWSRHGLCYVLQLNKAEVQWHQKQQQQRSQDEHSGVRAHYQRCEGAALRGICK